jgi:hypothetical protein
MQFERQEEVKFKTDVTKAILQLIALGKKLNINNIAKTARYTRRDIEENLYEIGLIIEKLEE